MSRFSNSLAQAIDNAGWNASRYCEQGKFNSSRVSRWINGTITPEPESLREIIAPFPAEVAASLLVAYIRDITENTAPGLVQVTTAETASLSEPLATYGKPAGRPDGISDELWSQICRVAELARDVPEIAAIIRELDSLIQRTKPNQTT